MERVKAFWRALRPGIAWLTAWTLVLAALVLWVAGLGEATSFFLIVIAAATSVVQLFRQLGDSAAQRAQLERQGQDIRRLAEIAQRTQEAQLAQQPSARLEVVDLRTDTAGDHLTITRPPLPVIERAAILKKRGRELRKTPHRTATKSGEEELFINALLRIQEANEPEYLKQVDNYEERLGEWLDEVSAALARQHALVQVPLRIGNVGGAPLQDAEVALHFPSGLAAGEEPSVPDGPPAAPKRHQGLGGLALRIPSLSDSLLPFPSHTVGARILDGPFASDAGDQVRYHLSALLHQRAIDATGDDALWVQATSDGDYEVEWEVHASNQVAPVHGTIRLSVQTLDTPPTSWTSWTSWSRRSGPASPINGPVEGRLQEPSGLADARSRSASARCRAGTVSARPLG